MSDDEVADPGLEAGAVLFEELDPAGDLAEREACLLLNEIRGVVGEPAGSGELIAQRQAVTQPVPQPGWCGHVDGFELVDRAGAVLARSVIDDFELADRFDASVTGLGDAGRTPGDHSSGRAYGIERVGLAVLAAGLAVGSIDLDDDHTSADEMTSETRAPTAGRLDPDAVQGAV